MEKTATIITAYKSGIEKPYLKTSSQIMDIPKKATPTCTLSNTWRT